MKIFNDKFNLVSLLKGGVAASFVFALCFIGTPQVQAQVISDLDPQTVADLQQTLEDEMILLKNEFQNTPQGVSTESNVNIVEYYATIWGKFNQGAELQHSFKELLYFIGYPNNEGTNLAEALFDNPPAPPANNQFGHPAGANYASYDLAIPAFKVLLDAIDVSSGDLTSVEAVMTMIRNNK